MKSVNTMGSYIHSVATEGATEGMVLLLCRPGAGVYTVVATRVCLLQSAAKVKKYAQMNTTSIHSSAFVNWLGGDSSAGHTSVVVLHAANDNHKYMRCYTVP